MHIKKNVFDNIFNTVMDMKEKTKEKIKVTIDLALYCDYGNMKLINDRFCVTKPKATLTLDKDA
jgi:hypothetical protein